MSKTASIQLSKEALDRIKNSIKDIEMLSGIPNLSIGQALIFCVNYTVKDLPAHLTAPTPVQEVGDE